MSQRKRVLILLAVTFAAVTVAVCWPRVPQSVSYHNFADQRQAFGIPNFLDVVSNLPFLVAGVYGLIVLRRSRFHDPQERVAYAILFAAVGLTCFGSSYYHLRPDNATLFWDRLPMTLAFTSFLSAMIAERLSIKAGLILLLPFLVAGLGSLMYWRWSESVGRGDIRPYIVVQFYPLLAILPLLALFPPRYSRQSDLLVVFVLYGGAKLLEWGDRLVFRVGGVVSGHTLKHLAAASACYWIARMVRKRIPIPAAGSEARGSAA